MHGERTLSCKTCGWTTNTKSKMKLHRECIRTKNIVCPFDGCRAVFDSKYILKGHIKRLHEGSMDFPCEHPDCKKSFYTKSERRTHTENCHGPRNIICDTCGRTFGNLTMLKLHNKNMHTETNFGCSYCDMNFTTSSSVNKHIKRVHERIKDHQCNQCNAMFYERSGLSNHIAVVHKGIRYKCQVPGCASSLARKDIYMFHLKQKHNNLDKSEMDGILRKCKEFMEQHNLVA
jgi:hypothetical protein